MVYAPNVTEGRRSVEEFRRRHAEHSRRAPRMQTHTNNLRAGRELSYKRIGPWANHDRRIVVDKHNVNTGVREYAMRILLDADDRLCPKAQKIVRKVCGNWEFPIVRDNRPLMCFKIHRSPKSHRLAVLPTSYLGLLASDGRTGSYQLAHRG